MISKLLAVGITDPTDLKDKHMDMFDTQTYEPVRRFPINTQGRDFVVGDIHGCFDLLDRALEQIAFDPKVDRLFSVGDLVDRGPLSHEALTFLRRPSVYAIRGNHEQMFLDIYEDYPNPSEAIIASRTANNGMSWWRNIPESTRQALLQRFASLPLVFEVETQWGLCGMVHADIPHGFTWREFTNAIRTNDRAVSLAAIWGRTRIQHTDFSGVAGIDAVYVGHTPVRIPMRLGNIHYIDTGAVFGTWYQDPEQGRLTIVQLGVFNDLYREEHTDKFIDVRQLISA